MRVGFSTRIRELIAFTTSGPAPVAVLALVSASPGTNLRTWPRCRYRDAGTLPGVDASFGTRCVFTGPVRLPSPAEIRFFLGWLLSWLQMGSCGDWARCDVDSPLCGRRNGLPIFPFQNNRQSRLILRDRLNRYLWRRILQTSYFARGRRLWLASGGFSVQP
ncbi:MAG: hypothetical protein RIS70_559 [Planctomycetota bacterium]